VKRKFWWNRLVAMTNPGSWGRGSRARETTMPNSMKPFLSRYENGYCEACDRAGRTIAVFFYDRANIAIGHCLPCLQKAVAIIEEP